MSAIWSNPEFIRNARTQLRTGRLGIAAVICVVGSITIWESVMHADFNFSVFDLQGYAAIFVTILTIQAGILVLGGGIACLMSVQREKELNTFDFQRVTRLTPLELAVGKLLGAPVAAYVAVLFLLPVALVAAARAHLPVLLVAEVYAVVLVSSLTLHAMALFVSVLLPRNGLAIGIFGYLWLVIVSYSPNLFSSWAIGTVGPYYVLELLMLNRARPSSGLDAYRSSLAHDWFFGIKLPHLAVFIVLLATITAWLLLGIRRMLKKDPALYEPYSPLQALFFTLYLGLLMVGFFPWTTRFKNTSFRMGDFTLNSPPASPNRTEQHLLQTGVVLFAALAIVLLRNRERTRRRVRALGERAAGWMAALWPAPYLIVAIATIAGAVVTLIGRNRNGVTPWDLRLAIFEAVFVCVWITRDALYLQWMSARRSRRALLSAMLYLTVFYLAAGILFSSIDLYRLPRGGAETALVFPTPLFALDVTSWTAQNRLWIGALLFQVASALIFAGLHRHQLRQLSSTTPAVSTN